MEQLLWLTSGAIIFFGVVLTHELGHYFYGRFFVNIPKDKIKLVMNSWPQYVALRAAKSDDWISPSDSEYQSVYKSFDNKFKKSSLFLASGYIFGLLIFFSVCVILIVFGIDPSRIIRISAFLNGVVLLLDAVSIIAKKQAGDISHLWTISRAQAVITVSAVVVIHVLAIFFI
jgi:hypothetical protein